MRNKRGITLIALVVTIVVLLILAGVSLNLVLGNNGIIAKSKDARDRTKLAVYTEEINLIASAEETSYKLEEISYDQMVQNVKSNIEAKKYVEQVNQKSVSIGTTLEATTDLGMITVVLSKDGVTVSEGEITLPEAADARIFNYAVTDDGNIEIKGFNLDNLEYDIISGCSELYSYNTTVEIKNMQTLCIPEIIEGKSVTKVAFAYNIYNGEEVRGLGVPRYGSWTWLGVCGVNTIIFPDTAKIMGECDDAFIDVNQVILNNGLETIESDAFFNMEKLETVTIPESVATVGYNAFSTFGDDQSITIYVPFKYGEKPEGWNEHWIDSYYGYGYIYGYRANIIYKSSENVGDNIDSDKNIYE